MALEINNATFNAFVDFAQTQEAAGKQKAVARLVDAPKDGPLAGRNIKAASGDWVGVGVGRLKSLKNANNVARDLFKAAVADIFNGEDNIPVKYAEIGRAHV